MSTRSQPDAYPITNLSTEEYLEHSGGRTTHDIYAQQFLQEDYESPFDVACANARRAGVPWDEFVERVKASGEYLEDRARLGLLTESERISLLSKDELRRELRQAEAELEISEAKIAAAEATLKGLAERNKHEDGQGTESPETARAGVEVSL
jgi:hypothetical protein